MVVLSTARLGGPGVDGIFGGPGVDGIVLGTAANAAALGGVTVGAGGIDVIGLRMYVVCSVYVCSVGGSLDGGVTG